MNEIDFAKASGMVPVIVQEADSGEVLMLAYMNEEAYRRTVDTGHAWFYSRSRDRLWMKGETSGHVQEVTDIFIDCDNDTVLLKVKQRGGAACHTGRKSCFYRRWQGTDWEEISEPLFDPDKVYGA